MRRKPLIVYVAVLSLIVAGALVGSLRHLHIARYEARSNICPPRLREFRLLLDMYAQDFNAAFPPTFSTLYAYCPAASPSFHTCPATQAEPGPMSDVDEWMGYVYVYWPDVEATPKDYPLMYDRRLANHKGRGINVLRMDNSVFWDAEGKWLKQFATEHPEFNITLPEDME